MKVLCVAEKPSIAKSITAILSENNFSTRQTQHQYIRNYDFDYNLPPPIGRPGGVDITVTSVLGHLTSLVCMRVCSLTDCKDFAEDFRKWHSCDPFALFEAPVTVSVSSVRASAGVRGPADW